MAISPPAGRCGRYRCTYICDFSRSVGSRKCNDPEDTWTHTLGNSLDGAALAGAVATLEEDADLLALVAHPFLELDQLDVQPLQFRFVVLALQLFIASLTALDLFERFLVFFAMLVVLAVSHFGGSFSQRSRLFLARE
jgi:hypothetical protein